MKHVFRILCVLGVVYVAGSPFPIYGQEAIGNEILKYLQDFDSVYKSGFTVSGESLAGDFKRDYKLTLSNEKIGYQEQVTEVTRLRSKGQGVAVRRTFYVGPEYHAAYDYVAQIWEVGKVPSWPLNSAGPANVGALDICPPDKGTYRLPVTRAIWSLGRGYSEYITEITNATRQENGLVSVTAEGKDEGFRPGARWELVIDPEAAYMVREARLYRAGKTAPFLSIVNSGVQWKGSRCIPEKTQTQLAIGTKATQTATHLLATVSNQTDEEFLGYCGLTMKPPYLVHTDRTDHRMSPAAYMPYNANELFPKSRGKEELLLFDGLDNRQISKTQEQSNAPPKESSKPNAKPPSANIEQDRIPDNNSVQAPLHESKPSLMPGTAASTGSGWTKRKVAWIVFIVSVVFGIAYLCFYMLQFKRPAA